MTSAIAQRNVQVVRDPTDALNSGGSEEVLARIEEFSDLGNPSYEAIGDRVVLALADVSGTGRGSGIRLMQGMGVVYELEGGRIVRGENFASQPEAEVGARQLAQERSGA